MVVKLKPVELDPPRGVIDALFGCDEVPRFGSVVVLQS